MVNVNIVSFIEKGYDLCLNRKTVWYINALMVNG